MSDKKNTLFGDDEAARRRCITAINSGRPFCEVDGAAPKLIPLHIPDYLTDPETILSYLQACLEEGGPDLFYKGLRDCQDRYTPA